MASPASSTAARILGPDSDEELVVEVRMGKMIMENTVVRPDLRKGTLRLVRGEGFFRIQWSERTEDYPEDDILVFPHEANFEKVQQSTGRVYILKFKQDDRKYFFWMQETDEKMDSDICGTIDYFLNHTSLESDDEEDDQIVALERTISRPEVIRKRTGENHSSSSVPVTPQSMTGSTQAAAVQLADLQRILSSITASGSLDTGAILQQDTGPSLADVLKPENVIPLLDGSFLDERLTQFLPEGSWTPQAIAELLQSPQFHQQVDALTLVLRSGQIDLSQFGIDSSKYNFTVLSFLEAIEDQVANKSMSNIASSSEDEIHKGNTDAEADQHMEGNR